jgi:hypothetical protein
MELSDEQKKRILEEERQRIAEEQYRAQVRKELSSANARRPEDGPKWSKENKRAVVLVLAVVAVSVGALIISTRNRVPNPGAATANSKIPSSTDHGIGTAKPAAVQEPQKLTTAQIADRATPAVVIVENFNEDGEKAGQGSGYVYSTEGVVITNYHVIRGARSVSVRVPSKEPIPVANLLGYSIENDVAALQIDEAPAHALETEITELVSVGDHVVAIGAPLGLESTVSEGIVSATRVANGTHIIQTTASISPGSSGGPLLNEYGKVIGLTTAEIREGQNLNFVVSARHIRELMARKRSITLEEMLSATKVVTQISSNTISIAARGSTALQFVVASQQGALLEGTYTVSGGTGNDIDVALVGMDGRPIVYSGRVKSSGEFKQRLPPGRYSVVFNNQFSTFSSKSVSPELRLSYFR